MGSIPWGTTSGTTTVVAAAVVVRPFRFTFCWFLDNDLDNDGPLAADDRTVVVAVVNAMSFFFRFPIKRFLDDVFDVPSFLRVSCCLLEREYESTMDCCCSCCCCCATRFSWICCRRVVMINNGLSKAKGDGEDDPKAKEPGEEEPKKAWDLGGSLGLGY